MKWDKGMRIYIKLQPRYKGKVCGLCGNYDLNAENDLTLRSGLVRPHRICFTVRILYLIVN